MTVIDTTDGLFMNLAYGWAFFNPVRKVYYNLAKLQSETPDGTVP